jgi:rubredoxin
MHDSVKVECAAYVHYPQRMNNQAPVDTPLRTFMCVVCGFIYNEAEGWPADGIVAGTRWEDVPETWTCPDCGVTKSDFEMIELG